MKKLLALFAVLLFVSAIPGNETAAFKKTAAPKQIKLTTPETEAYSRLAESFDTLSINFNRMP